MIDNILKIAVINFQFKFEERQGDITQEKFDLISN